MGRTAEQAIFQTAIQAAELPFFVLHIFGPGGVGKTTLLGEFARLCAQANVPAALIDARDLDPAPSAFIQALQHTMGLPLHSSLAHTLADRARRHVILIDTFEKLKSLEVWLKDDFLPQLPENVLVVIAGRHPPLPGWRVDPGWQALLKLLPLRNFSPTEAAAYLSGRAVPNTQHRAIMEFTYGHPLALSLIADMFAQRHPFEFKPQAAHDAIKTLLAQLVQKVPSPAHRAALEACALVRMTTEPLLAAMLATPDAHELFEWLRGLSCVESGPLGLFPHDLARETLTTDLHWRNPDWYAELHRRARGYYSERLKQMQSQDQQAILIDYIFLHRDNPVVRPFFVQLQSQWHEESGGLLIDQAAPADWPAISGMIARHEGPESAALARHWGECQPEAVLVLRQNARDLAGVLFMVALHQATPHQIEVDPAAAAAWRYLTSHSPLRAGERATCFRFWLAKDTYQGVSTVQSLIFVNMVRHYLTTPNLAITLLPCADADFWAPVFAYADLTRVPDLDFTVDGKQFGVYSHDWRVVPPTAWLELLAERETTVNPPAAAPPPPPRPLVVLSQPDFSTAVQQALRDLRAGRPDTLRENPLLWSRLITDQTGLNADDLVRAAALQTIIRETAEQLQLAPRQMKLYKTLYHTYFHPAPTQENAAELLDLPFSTYRRYLKAGISHLTEAMWQREIGRFEK